MIYYDRKYVMKRIWRTWRESRLEAVGVYEFIVKDKAIVKLYEQTANNYILELLALDGKYEGILIVGQDEYNKHKIGNVFGKCTVLIHEKERDYIIISKNSVPEYAIKEVASKSKIYLLVLTLIIVFSIISIVLLLIPFIK